MKVRLATEEDKQLIFSLYNTATKMDSRSIDYFFTALFDPCDFLIYEEKEMVFASMYIKSEALYFKGYNVEVAIIQEVLFAHQLSSEMKTLFINEAISYFEDEKLFTILRYKGAKDLDFEAIFKEKRYKLYRKDLFNVDGYSISSQFTVEDLKEAYDTFVVHFDSYLIKDLEYFEKKLNVLKVMNYEIYVTRNSKNSIVGYIVYNYIDGELEVVKVVYEDTLALLTLLNQAMGMNSHIYVTVSLNESLERVFETIDYEIKSDVLMRINDLELFARLYNSQCQTLTEFLDKNQRPLYLGFY